MKALGIPFSMKMSPECRQCLVGRVQYVADLIGSQRGPEATQAAREYLDLHYRPNATPNIPMASEIHRLTNHIIGDRDPWMGLKERSNRMAMRLLPKAKELVEASEDPFLATVIASIVGNSFDFGIKGRKHFDPETMGNEFEGLMSEGLGVDNSLVLKALLKKGGEVLYCVDNCGEIVFDKLLVDQLRDYPVTITLLVKGGPVLTDATRDDAVEVGLADMVDDIIDTGTDHVGCWLPESDPELIRRVENADLILAKGMGYYEAFSEWAYRPIAHLLRTKCQPVADSLGVAKDINVCRVIE